jgi:hypothetical protein
MSAVDISAEWIMDDLYHMYGGTDEKTHTRKIKDFHVRFNKSKKVMKKHFKKIADAKKTYATNPKENTTTTNTTSNTTTNTTTTSTAAIAENQVTDDYDDSDDDVLTITSSSNKKPLSIQEVEEILNIIEKTMTDINAYICKYQHMRDYLMPRKVEEARKLLTGFQQKKELAIDILNRKKALEHKLWAENKEKERLFNSTRNDTFNDFDNITTDVNTNISKSAKSPVRALYVANIQPVLQVKKPVMKLQTLPPMQSSSPMQSSTVNQVSPVKACNEELTWD